MGSLILKYPVACFTGLTFIISLAIGLPLKLFVLDHLLVNSELGANYLSKAPVVCGPAISAVIISYLSNGMPGLFNLLVRLKPYTIHIIWWIGLPVAGIIITGLAFIAGGFAPGELTNFVITASPILLMVHFAAAFILTGIGEELGWRGWLLPQLANGKSLIQTTLFTGAIWALWHLPIYLISDKISILFVLLPLVISVMFTWLWNRVGGNVFVLAIAHASLEFPFIFFESRIGTGHDEKIEKALIALAALYLLLAIITYWFDRKRFSIKIKAPNERFLS